MKLYWYELIYRGISPGAMPRNPIVVEHNHVNLKRKNYGAVAYTRKLTLDEVTDYELNPIDPPRELYDYEEYLINKQ